MLTWNDIAAYTGFIHEIVSRFRGLCWDDLTQDTLLKAYENRDKYDDTYTMNAWLATMARRLCIDAKRRKANFVAEVDHERLSEWYERRSTHTVGELLAKISLPNATPRTEEVLRKMRKTGRVPSKATDQADYFIWYYNIRPEAQRILGDPEQYWYDEYCFESVLVN